MPRHLFLSACVAAVCSLLLAAPHGEAQQPPLKIAVIDMEKVFLSYYKTKIADANLKKQAETYRNYLTSLSESKLKLREEFKELRDDSQNIAIAESERENKRIAAQDKYRQLQAKEAEIEQYNQEKKKKLLEEYDKIKESLIDEIAKIVKSRGLREGYTLILDKSGKTLNSIPTIVYHEEGMDITDIIMREINLGHEDKIDKVDKTEKADKTIDATTGADTEKARK